MRQLEIVSGIGQQTPFEDNIIWVGPVDMLLRQVLDGPKEGFQGQCFGYQRTDSCHQSAVLEFCLLECRIKGCSER